MPEEPARTVAVVSGAASGMGRAMARALAAAGATLAAVDVDAAGLERLGAEAGVTPDRFLAVPTDVSQLEACRHAIAAVVERFGTLHVLVNCAGVSMAPATPPDKQHPVRFWETDPQGWLTIQLINSAGAYFMTRFAAEHLMRNGWGRIVNVTTSFDTMLGRGMSAYGAAKAGLEASAAIWAKELDGTGVTVNVLIPGGRTDTPFLPPEGRGGTLLQPEVMAAPIRWLASTGSDGVNGRRFVARLWDESLPPAEAAARAGAPVAWEAEAAAATQSR